ncbi:MAG: LysM peptidoglycan-binding domain-containing protein [Candidatus Sericytochromatia bacterium]|nr:LysM peptidoglycan-binding domain-containing protein [Candidatus Sericytochromatia bacterium]
MSPKPTPPASSAASDPAVFLPVPELWQSTLIRCFGPSTNRFGRTRARSRRVGLGWQAGLLQVVLTGRDGREALRLAVPDSWHLDLLRALAPSLSRLGALRLRVCRASLVSTGDGLSLRIVPHRYRHTACPEGSGPERGWLETALPRAAAAMLLSMPALPAAAYTISASDTLSSISRQHYGDAGAWRAIFEANRAVLTDPNRLKPGMQLVIPARAQHAAPAQAQPTARAGLPAPHHPVAVTTPVSSKAAGGAVAPQAKRAASLTAGNTITVIVKPGDTLGGIAARHLGTHTRWQAVWEANRHTVHEPDLLQIGQVLTLPAGPTPSGVVTMVKNSQPARPVVRLSAPPSVTAVARVRQAFQAPGPVVQPSAKPATVSGAPAPQASQQRAAATLRKAPTQAGQQSVVPIGAVASTVPKPVALTVSSSEQRSVDAVVRQRVAPVISGQDEQKPARPVPTETGFPTWAVAAVVFAAGVGIYKLWSRRIADEEDAHIDILVGMNGTLVPRYMAALQRALGDDVRLQVMPAPETADAAADLFATSTAPLMLWCPEAGPGSLLVADLPWLGDLPWPARQPRSVPLVGTGDRPSAELVSCVRGLMHLAAGDSAQALSDFGNLSTLAPASADWQGLAWEHRKVPVAACVRYAGSASAEARFNLARCLMQVGDKRTAKETWQAILMDDPGNGGAAYWLGRLLREEGHHAEALAALQQATNPEAPTCWVLAGDIHSELGEWETAVSLYSQAIPAMSGDSEVWLRYGLALSRLGQLQAGIEATEKAVALLPTAVSLTQLGEQVGKLGDWPKALALFERAYELEPASDETLRCRAFALSHLRRWDEAIVLYERLLDHYPTNVGLRLALAALQGDRQGDWDARSELDPTAVILHGDAAPLSDETMAAVKDALQRFGRTP